VPPVGVYIVAGCGPELVINIALTILGFLPGHIHAFYVIYVYYNEKEQASERFYDDLPASDMYNDNVRTGGQVRNLSLHLILNMRAVIRLTYVPQGYETMVVIK
jgi:uncharacterized membrane protein YqaE (UPF0057 family)